MMGREKEFELICQYMGTNSPFSSLLIVGPPKCGKSTIVNEVCKSLKNCKFAQVSCLSACIRLADVFEEVLKQIGVVETCTTFADFVNRLNKVSKIHRLNIVLKDADRLRSSDLLAGLLKLNELVDGFDVCLVLISKLPWSKWRLSQHLAAAPPVQVYIKPYSRNQLEQILHESLAEDGEPQCLKDNFVSLILSVFQPVCKSLPQFQRASRLLWPEYVKPTKEGTSKIEPDNARSLYRCVESFMKKILLNIHYQESTTLMGEEFKSKRLNVELPFFSKFLLLAAFLASYNPASTDKKFFMRGRTGGRVIKKSKRKQQAHKKSSQLLGPKMFDLNRMLAIFHVIVEQKVTSTAEIQSQVASLVTLQMLTQSGEDLDQPKYKCNVSLDFIRQVAKNVRFELHKYLYDVEN